MQITFKLYAMLTEYLPADRRTSNLVVLDVPEGSSISSVVSGFNLPMNLVHLVLVNGVYVAREARDSHALVEGDVLAIWPPIAGG